MKEFKELLGRYKRAKEDAEMAEQLAKDAKSRLYDMSTTLCDYARDNMIDDITIDGERVRVKYKQKYEIKGGKKETESSTEFLSLLEEAGYGEDVKTYKSIHETKLRSVLARMPVEFVQSLISKKYISVFDYPEIKIDK